MPSPNPKITKEEVLAELANRDRREHPALSISQLGERFDVSNKTVRRRIDELVQEGAVNEENHGRVSVYWVNHDESQGVCPECGGILEKDDEYEPGYWCRMCGSAFAEVTRRGEPTKYGRTVQRASRMMVWWASLPSSFQRLVAFIATTFLTDEKKPDTGGYRPERVRINDDELPDTGAAARGPGNEEETSGGR